MSDTTFNQEQVNAFVKSAKEDATTKLLNDLGIESVDSFKTKQNESNEKIKTLETQLNENKGFESELAAYKLKDVKTTKALEKGLPLESLNLITATEEEAIDTQIDSLVSLIGNNNSNNSTNVNNTENKTKQNTSFGDALKNKLGEVK